MKLQTADWLSCRSNLCICLLFPVNQLTPYWLEVFSRWRSMFYWVCCDVWGGGGTFAWILSSEHFLIWGWLSRETIHLAYGVPFAETPLASMASEIRPRSQNCDSHPARPNPCSMQNFPSTRPIDQPSTLLPANRPNQSIHRPQPATPRPITYRHILPIKFISVHHPINILSYTLIFTSSQQQQQQQNGSQWNLLLSSP